MAKACYRDGVRQKERAWKQEEKAAKEKKDRARDKALAQAQKSYKKAVDYQIKALQILPTHNEAANELGYALRETGDYKRAIGAYNLALELKPDFWQALEYRGEALLAMGFFGETKEAHMTLFREEQDLAVELMTAIRTCPAPTVAPAAMTHRNTLPTGCPGRSAQPGPHCSTIPPPC
ncbi:MAG: tetratricopeptide repeat protein [Pseudomonadales bacterium]|nr:tetratricopeptide repeat protein [Pseudomonadales bacterium]